MELQVDALFRRQRLVPLHGLAQERLQIQDCPGEPLGVPVVPQLHDEGAHPIQPLPDVGRESTHVLQSRVPGLEGIQAGRDAEDEAAELMHEAWHEGGRRWGAKGAPRLGPAAVHGHDGLDVLGQEPQGLPLPPGKAGRRLGQHAQGADGAAAVIHQGQHLGELQALRPAQTALCVKAGPP
ncbi:MAG: hypothetical protein IPO28_12450 [Holophagaceae bacterium]|nr:hypothetical protein [Holophagaceae bacterium]